MAGFQSAPFCVIEEMSTSELGHNLFFLLGPIISLILAHSFDPPGEYIVTVFLLYVAGFLLFLVAKYSVLKEGILFSFGTKHMSRLNRTLYMTGYSFIGVGLFLTILVLILRF